MPYFKLLKIKNAL